MEWYGVNLNNYHFNHWKQKTIFSVVYICLLIVLSLMIAISILLNSKQNNINNNKINQQIIEKQESIRNNAQQIDFLKQTNMAYTLHQAIGKKDLEKILLFIKELPIDGGVEIIRVFKNEIIQIQLIGKISQESFQSLEYFFKQRETLYQITQLQSDEQHQIEFQLNIEWGN